MRLSGSAVLPSSNHTVQDSFRRVWFAPVFSTLLGDRLESGALAGTGALVLGLHLAGVPLWPCPIKSILGFPCPGCGLTTAMGQLLHGQIRESLRTHAFAPVFAMVLLVMLVALMLPEPQRKILISAIARLEGRTALTAWFLTALLLYWGIRLFGFV